MTAARRSKRISQWTRALSALVTALCAAPSAQASFIDTDFYCRVYGCVIVHDGFAFDVYDAFDFATGQPVPVGGKLVLWRSVPALGTGGVQPVITGTRTRGPQGAPLVDQGARIGIDQTGDGVADRVPAGGSAAGYLDAGDTFNPFTLTATTDLVSAESSAQRSFYISSRLPFNLTARVFPANASDPAQSAQRFSQIAFQYQVTNSGTDDGMEFGRFAQPGNGLFRAVGSVNDLGDMIGTARPIMEFRKEIRQKDSASLPAQSIRFDYVYGFGSYDLSMGAGDFSFRMEFDFYRR